MGYFPFLHPPILSHLGDGPLECEDTGAQVKVLRSSTWMSLYKAPSAPRPPNMKRREPTYIDRRQQPLTKVSQWHIVRPLCMLWSTHQSSWVPVTRRKVSTISPNLFPNQCLQIKSEEIIEIRKHRILWVFVGSIRKKGRQEICMHGYTSHSPFHIVYLPILTIFHYIKRRYAHLSAQVYDLQ